LRDQVRIGEQPLATAQDEAEAMLGRGPSEAPDAPCARPRRDEQRRGEHRAEQRRGEPDLGEVAPG
jgi:hypothetical protein